MGDKKIARMEGSLEGNLLIAMPTISDGCFARSVVYMCAHSEEGAMGLIVNQAAPGVAFPDLLEQLDIVEDDYCVGAPSAVHTRTVHVGGPVETSRGFVLHSPDYFVASSSVRVQDGICLTATLDILKAMLSGNGPERALLALGYAGWSPGQLEAEISHNGWLHCQAEPDLVFDTELDTKYQRALSQLGVADLSHLVNDAGHA